MRGKGGAVRRKGKRIRLDEDDDDLAWLNLDVFTFRSADLELHKTMNDEGEGS